MRAIYVIFFVFLLDMGSLFTQTPVVFPWPQELHSYDFFSAIFVFDSSTTIVASKETVDIGVVEFLQYQLSKLGISGNKVVFWSPEDPQIQEKALYLGIGDSYIDFALNVISPNQVDINQSYPGKGGYALQIMPPGAAISGSDREGLLNGIRTFLQLYNKDRMPSLRIIDAPDYENRWFKYWNNLLVDKNVNDTKAMIERIASLKYNGMLFDDFKFNIISKMWQKYYDSLQSVDRHFDNEGLKFIAGVFPIGYSEALLYFNPNLASGLPVRNQKFVIHDDTARLVHKGELVKNGGFENYNGNTPSGFSFIDAPGEISFIDNSIKHSGAASLRFENFSSSNARIILQVNGKAFTQYKISGWIKTENLSPVNSLNITAIGKRGLLYPELNIPSTSDWQKITLTFNSLDADTFYVYWGAWGAKSGKIWWDDISLQEESFVNLIRREGAPLNVSHQVKDIAYIEGKAYDTLRDEILQKGQIDFWHQPPFLTIPENSPIVEGDTLLVSYYHTTPIYSGQTMVTLSEDETYKIMESQFKMLDSLLTVDSYFMNHDEIRLLGWDAGDEDRGLTPAEIIADNVNRSYDIVKKYNPEADVWMWSDMIDDFHNAVEGPYYLVNGSLKGSANLIDKNIGIMNWNSGKPDSSLNFFANKGFRQIAAGFIDGGLGTVRMWIEKSKNIEKFEGLMYVTWTNNYDLADEFAQYSWNSAPFIMHNPPTKEYYPRGLFKIDFSILGDIYNPNWQLKSAKLHFRVNPSFDFEELDLMEYINDGSLTLDLDTINSWLQYYFTAADNLGNTARLPYGNNHYFVFGDTPVPGAQEPEDALKLMLYPQPALGDVLNISVNISIPEAVSINIVALNGSTLIKNNLFLNSGSNLIKQNISNLPKGVYSVVLIKESGTVIQTLSIQ